MPEGDTLRFLSVRMRAALAGRTITRTDFRVPAAATIDLAGAEVLDVVSRGKHLLMRVDNGGEVWTIHSHLRMEGRWDLRPVGARRPGPDWQIRAIVATDSTQAIGLRLGLLTVLPTADEHLVIGHLGPDPLGDDYDQAEAAVRVSDAGLGIGAALLDQRRVCGLGTNLVAEACSVAGVAPHESATPEIVARVLPVAERMIRANSTRVRRVTTGRDRAGERSWVFGRRTCLRCRGAITIVNCGPPTQRRILAWCPRCQPVVEIAETTIATAE